MWVRLPPRAPLFTNTYGDLSRAAYDPNRRPFTLTLPAAWLNLLRCIVCRAAKGASQPRKIPLDRLCMVCYYTCQVRVRTFFDCGSFSAAFPFFGAENVGQSLEPHRPAGTFAPARWPKPSALSYLESTHAKASKFAPLTPFRINTCKGVSKQRTLTPFRMNTYENRGDGVQLLLTRNPTERVSPDAPTITDHHPSYGGLGQHFGGTATHPIRTGKKPLRRLPTSPTILRVRYARPDLADLRRGQ